MKFTVSNVGLHKKDGEIAWAKPVNNYWPTREPKHYVSEAEKRANCMRVDVRSIEHMKLWEDEIDEGEKAEAEHIRYQMAQVTL